MRLVNAVRAGAGVSIASARSASSASSRSPSPRSARPASRAAASEARRTASGSIVHKASKRRSPSSGPARSWRGSGRLPGEQARGVARSIDHNGPLVAERVLVTDRDLGRQARLPPHAREVGEHHGLVGRLGQAPVAVLDHPVEALALKRAEAQRCGRVGQRLILDGAAERQQRRLAQLVGRGRALGVDQAPNSEGRRSSPAVSARARARPARDRPPLAVGAPRGAAARPPRRVEPGSRWAPARGREPVALLPHADGARREPGPLGDVAYGEVDHHLDTVKHGPEVKNPSFRGDRLARCSVKGA